MQNNFKCFDKYKNDIKNTWKTISGIICKSKPNTYPDFFIENDRKLYDEKIIANKFNSYSTDIGPNLAERISTTSDKDFTSFLKNKPTSKLCFEEINESTISKIIDELPSKSSCGHDDISLKITKYLKNVISLPLTTIINQTLNTGIFPDTLKIAKVRPLYKKGDNRLLSNYRPISLLPSFSKIFEKVIYQQTYSYFQTNNLLYSSQYGFRSGHSTEYAGLEIVDRIIQGLDKNEIPINIYLDLSKAFDTLDHSILLQKLKFYGITGISLDVFENYLRWRNVTSLHVKP